MAKNSDRDEDDLAQAAIDEQVFEVLPQPEYIPGLYDLLRYEKATLRAEITQLESDLERSTERLAELELRLDQQQTIIDALTAALAAARND